MSVVHDYADIQGNILLPYGKQGFPAGRNILLHVDDAAGGRNFVTGLLPFITTALLWSDSTRRASGKTAGERAERPKVAVNIAFTFGGLLKSRCSDPNAAGTPGGLHRRNDLSRPGSRRRFRLRRRAGFS